MSSRWLNAVRISTPQSRSPVIDARRLEAVHARHLDVEDGQVGLQLAHQLDRLVAPAGLADDVVALLLEGLAQVEADDRFVFSDHNTNRHWRRSLRFGVDR